MADYRDAAGLRNACDMITSVVAGTIWGFCTYRDNAQFNKAAWQRVYVLLGWSVCGMRSEQSALGMDHGEKVLDTDSGALLRYRKIRMKKPSDVSN